MIVLKSYSQMAGYIEVTLRCTCGNQQIVEETSELEKVYLCKACRSSTTLKRLRHESSTQWRDQHWVVRMEKRKEKRKEKRIEVELTVKINAVTARDKRALPMLVGKARNISSKGMAVQVNNLTHEFLKLYKTNVCEAEVSLPVRLQKFVPRKLRALIVFVDYKEEDLPQGRIGLSFVNLSQADRQRIQQYLKMLE